MAVSKRIEQYAILSPGKWIVRGKPTVRLLITLIDLNREIIGYLYYLPDGESLPDSSINLQNRMLIYKHIGQASIDIDMLRNESPVYAVYHSPTQAWIGTTSEPVGEGEI